MSGSRDLKPKAVDTRPVCVRCATNRDDDRVRGNGLSVVECYARFGLACGRSTGLDNNPQFSTRSSKGKAVRPIGREPVAMIALSNSRWVPSSPLAMLSRSWRAKLAVPSTTVTPASLSSVATPSRRRALVVRRCVASASPSTRTSARSPASPAWRVPPLHSRLGPRRRLPARFCGRLRLRPRAGA